MATIGQYKGIDITGGNDSTIQAQIAQIDAGNMKPIKPITPTDLTSVAPVTIPPMAAPTGAAAFQGQLESMAGLQASANQAKSQKDNAGQQLADALFGAQGQTALQDQLYSQKGGVDQLSQELSDINNQIVSEQVGLQRQLEAIGQNSEGLTRGAVESLKQDAIRKSTRTQADLAVVQMAKQGRYDSAKAIADRAINVQLEKQRTTIDTLRFMYDEVSKNWAEADKRAFQVAQAERERQYANEDYKLRAEFDAKIKQSDPMYQLGLEQARTDLAISRMKLGVATKPSSPLQLSKQQNSIFETGSLVTNPALKSAVGPNPLARIGKQSFTGEKENFIGSIEQLRSTLNIDTLIQAKGSGATFGALSDQELRILGSAATKLGTWAIQDKKGNVVGYDVDEKSFTAELDKINNFAKLDYIIKGGDPAEIGVQVMPDGTLWAQNSDGSLTQLQ